MLGRWCNTYITMLKWVVSLFPAAHMSTVVKWTAAYQWREWRHLFVAVVWSVSNPAVIILWLLLLCCSGSHIVTLCYAKSIRLFRRTLWSFYSAAHSVRRCVHVCGYSVDLCAANMESGVTIGAELCFSRWAQSIRRGRRAVWYQCGITGNHAGGCFPWREGNSIT